MQGTGERDKYLKKHFRFLLRNCNYLKKLSFQMLLQDGGQPPALDVCVLLHFTFTLEGWAGWTSGCSAAVEAGGKKDGSLTWGWHEGHFVPVPPKKLRTAKKIKIKTTGCPPNAQSTKCSTSPLVSDCNLAELTYRFAVKWKKNMAFLL